MRLYNTKIIKSKNITEYFINLDGYVAYDFKGVEGVKKRKFEELSTVEKMESIRKREHYYKNKKYVIKRLIDCNYDNRSTFLTLTFRENLQDIEIANREFTLFIKRLKRYLKQDIKYIATWELQKRGAIHYHLVLFSVPYINNVKLTELWANGFIKINQIKDKVEREAVAVYITKYFTKGIEKKEKLKKAYFCSRNLIKPLELKKFYNYDKINEIILNEEDLIYSREYEIPVFIGRDDEDKKIFGIRKNVYLIRINKNACKNVCKKNLNVIELKKNIKAQKEVTTNNF